ncbi:MAG: hypothetical protein A2Y33_13495 [Spirochaetes bacterium GWF1_51_8]|nr:MAG: hypothetical protein A2Y33_13495 [Spirochaetes bacterium GWF1_51_8]
MKISKILILPFLALVMALGAVNSGYSYCLTAWCGIAPERQIVLNPIVSGALDGVSYTDWEFITGFGVAENVDFYFSTALYGLIRYDFSGTDLAIVGLKASAADLSIEYHGNYPLADFLLLEFNVAFLMPYGSMLDTPAVSGIVSPIVMFTPDFAMFVEIDPSYSFDTNTGFALKLVPGITLFDGAATLGVPIVIAGGNISIGYSAMFAVGFDTLAPAPEAE